MDELNIDELLDNIRIMCSSEVQENTYDSIIQNDNVKIIEQLICRSIRTESHHDIPKS